MCLTCWRCRRLGLPYGDQGLLVQLALGNALALGQRLLVALLGGARRARTAAAVPPVA